MNQEQLLQQINLLKIRTFDAEERAQALTNSIHTFLTEVQKITGKTDLSLQGVYDLIVELNNSVNKTNETSQTPAEDTPEESVLLVEESKKSK